MEKIYKVLLAEDDAPSAGIVLHALERYNIWVTVAEDGMMAFTRLKKEAYDLVITDIMMPHLDGLTFIERAKELLDGVPIIVLTAVGEKEYVLRAAKDQVNSYILKPIQISKLVETVVSALKIRKTDLIDKRMIPFRSDWQRPNSLDLRLALSGCPQGNVEADIQQKIQEFVTSGQTADRFFLQVREEFGYEKNSGSILEAIVKRFQSATKMKFENIVLEGNYFKFFSKEITTREALAKCTIGSTEN